MLFCVLGVGVMTNAYSKLFWNGGDYYEIHQNRYSRGYREDQHRVTKMLKLYPRLRQLAGQSRKQKKEVMDKMTDDQFSGLCEEIVRAVHGGW